MHWFRYKPYFCFMKLHIMLHISTYKLKTVLESKGTNKTVSMLWFSKVIKEKAESTFLHHMSVFHCGYTWTYGKLKAGCRKPSYSLRALHVLESFDQLNSERNIWWTLGNSLPLNTKNLLEKRNCHVDQCRTSWESWIYWLRDHITWFICHEKLVQIVKRD